MGNQFVDYLTALSSYSKSDIQLQFLLSLGISLLFICVIKFILKKVPVTENYKKQYIGCGFLITLIYNLVAPYISAFILRSYLINTILNALILLIIIAILSFIEFLIISSLEHKSALLLKYFIWQGISIPIFTLIVNGVLLLKIVLISSFL